MNKKLLSIAVASAMIIGGSAAMAEDNTPTVFVNSSEIMFEDQAPVILGEGTTLIPARGVFEAMGATVTWYEDTRLVEITSADGNTVVRITIDDNIMRVYDKSEMFATLLAGKDFVAPETQVELEVAPQIYNERTMIPLRAISEAINADVKWDGDAYTIDINTKDALAVNLDLPVLSLSSDTTSAAEGEEFSLYVSAANIPEGTFVSGVAITIKYDDENFEFVGATLMNGEEAISSDVGGANPEFEKGYLKASYITINSETAAKADGRVLKLTFKSLTGKEGKFNISNSYHSRLGYNNEFVVDTEPDEEGNTNSMDFQGQNLVLDGTEVVINGDAVESDEAAEATEETTETTENTEAADTEAAAE